MLELNVILDLPMTRIISVSSGKGGVGKTTVTSNLGSALIDFGFDALVLDANITNANLGFHLGIPLYPTTLHDVLKDEAHLTEATYIHNSGLRVIPGSLSIDDLKDTSPSNIADVVMDIVGDPEIILIDSAAGLGNEATKTIEASDETIIVTTPDLPSVTDALKTANVAEKAGTHILGIVLNKHSGGKHELSPEEVEDMIEHPVLAVIPQNKLVPRSISEKTPIIDFRPEHHISERFRSLAADIAGIDYEPKKQSIFSKIREMFG
ncbi:MAG: cell division ATPase MinD [Candidatus Nanohaloarchaeota archaeon QJJ-9]|nr:cell division ATPase MinD [Candidatus Nanohaloarchaeota archaeon QJJ-9]